MDCLHYFSVVYMFAKVKFHVIMNYNYPPPPPDGDYSYLYETVNGQT